MTDAQLLDELREALAAAGLEGSFLARDLASGEELGLDADRSRPMASLAKVPLAVAVLDAVRRGALDAAAPIEVAPGRVETPGPMGLTRFRHPARVALEDLVYLAVAVSDNVAADALFDLVGPAEVTAAVRALGIQDVVVRHRMRDLARTPAEALDPQDRHLAQALAIGAGGADDAHAVLQLDVGRASVATARAFADLLEELWRPRRLDAGVAAQVRSLLAANVVRHRLAPDFTADDMTWSSKTGTLLHLRHEAGVVEHADGQRIALVALTASTVPAAAQPGADARMAAVARRLHDRLRR